MHLGFLGSKLATLMSCLTLSPDEGRKLALLAQGLPPAAAQGSAIAASLTAIEHLGYIQIDTISVVERAHDHTLWNRNPRYRAEQLDQLLKRKAIFEYWSHAAAYLPMRDYRFSLPRKEALAAGKETHWGNRDKRLMNNILKRIESEGPLMARDFERPKKSPGDWSRSPAKRALEHLFMQGELMVPRRENFHKVYDLTERVLPANLDTSTPDQQEHARFLVLNFLRAHGLGRSTEIAHLLKGKKPRVTAVLAEMALGGEVIEVRVGGHTFHALPSMLTLLDKPLSRRKAKVLSPFDNLVIHRQRLRDLFDFNYVLECYVPQPKRRYGYFVLPILWQGRLLARMDCKARRKDRVLDIYRLDIEAEAPRVAGFIEAFAAEFVSFARFCQCDRVVLHKASPHKYRAALRAELTSLS